MDEVKRNQLRLLPFGGVGRMGGNMMLYETARSAWLVDCGSWLPGAQAWGVDSYLPNFAALRHLKDKLLGLVLTHAHEDHIGAVPYFCRAFPGVPLFGTRFTLGMVQAKIRYAQEWEPTTDNPKDANASDGAKSGRTKMVTIRDGEPFQLGDASIEPIPVTHSIPDAVALAMRTPAGMVLHSGDFKVDPAPLDNRHFAADRLRELGDEGIALLLADSTNALEDGHTPSENDVIGPLTECIQGGRQRVVVGVFSSNVHRVQMVVNAAAQTGRTIVAAGFSVQRTMEVAQDTGHLKLGSVAMVGPDQVHQIPRENQLVIASGCQGDWRGALWRMATQQHSVPLEAGDRVIFSSSVIPGNAIAVASLKNQLLRCGAEVFDSRDGRVHASGHARRDELRQLLELCRPKCFMPKHGEYQFLQAHKQLAMASGVKASSIRVVEDGTPVLLSRSSQNDTAYELATQDPIEVPRQPVDGSGVGDVDRDVIRARRNAGSAGVVVCSLHVGRDNRLEQAPTVLTHGVLGETLAERLHGEAIEAVAEAWTAVRPDTTAEAQLEIVRLELRRFFKAALGRRPVILPQIFTVPGGS